MNTTDKPIPYIDTDSAAAIRIRKAAPQLLAACEAADKILAGADRDSSGGLVIWHRLTPVELSQLRIALRGAIAAARGE